MRTLLLFPFFTLISVTAAFANIPPIPGSITFYKADARLEKSPAGSVLFHSFSNGDGREVREVYRVQEDKSLKIVSRTTSNNS